MGTVTLGGCWVVVGVVWFWGTCNSGEWSTSDKIVDEETDEVDDIAGS